MATKKIVKEEVKEELTLEILNEKLIGLNSVVQKLIDMVDILTSRQNESSTKISVIERKMPRVAGLAMIK